MTGRILWLAALTTGLLLPQASRCEEGNSFVLRAGQILPVSPGLPWVIRDGIVVVRDGRITAVGADVEIPRDLPLIERPDEVVMPGLVAAITEEGGRHGGDESIAAGYLAADAFDRYGNFARTLAAGVTTVHLNAGDHRLLSGQGAVVKLAGPPESRVLLSQADLNINLGEAINAPPPDVTFPFPASSDVAIPVPKLQRPSSRMGQLIGLDEALEAALGDEPDAPYSHHSRALAAAWKAGRALRVNADRAVDLLAALDYLKRKNRKGYLVGGAEAYRVAATLRREKVPLVYRPRSRFRSTGMDLGSDPDVLSTDYGDLDRLDGVTVALGVPLGQPISDLRLAAVAVCGAGVDARRTLEAVTRIPAEILGVAQRVGSLAPGRDADLLVLSDDPLKVRAHVRQVFVNGVKVFESRPSSGALVVRAGTIWVSPEKRVRDGEILIEDGKIAAVGESVPHPPSARVIDAGPDAFVTPGFVDGRGHLGMMGDRSSVPPDIDLTRLVGAPDETHRRVARAGVTTVVMSPYTYSPRGSRLSAVKTAGRSREERVLRGTAAVAFNVRGGDPATVEDSTRNVLAAGKRYLEKWQKYEKELAEYLEKKKKGEKIEGKKPDEVVKEAVADPITGVWAGEAFGGPLPAPQSGKVALQLDGDQVEGRVIDPVNVPEHRIVMTLGGKRLTGYVEVDTGGMGQPKIEAEIIEEDKITGKATVAGISVQFRGTRVEKGAVEFKVTKRRRSRGGRPLPPKVDPSLEPIRALLEKRIPALVDVSGPAQIREILKLFLDEFKTPVVLLNAEGAHQNAERLAKAKVGVVLPRNLVRQRHHRDFHLGDDLARRGIPLAFQSGAEDGARDLPFHVLYAVERGLAADAALAALTLDVARMYKLDDRIGSLEPGKDGDLNIFRGHPFKAGSRVQRVIINGEEVKP